MVKPQEPKFWDRRPWPSHGDSEESQIYMAVGRALTCWERLEVNLSALFSAFTSPTNQIAAKRAFASVRTFEGRADMLRASSSAYFEKMPNDMLLDQFKNVLSESTQAARRRNDIAHGALDRFFSKEVWERKV